MTNSPDSNMALVDHLVELRDRLIRSLYGVAVGMSVCLYFSEQILSAIKRPIVPFLPSGGLIFTGVMDKFLTHLQLSLYCGILLSSPWWFLQIWKFVAPGLHKTERRMAVGFIGSGVFLLASGVMFSYFIVFPAAFKYLLTFGSSTDQAMITLKEYLSFVAWMSLVFGLAFELPLILVIMAIFGLVDQKILRKNRRYAVVIMAVLSAVVTPPDLLSMVMLLGPLMILYELSILVIGLFAKRVKSV